MAKYKYWQIDNEQPADAHIIYEQKPKDSEETQKDSEAVQEDSEETQEDSEDAAINAKIALLTGFAFKVKRYKDSKIKKEIITITAYINGQELGRIITNLVNIDRDIPSLKEYGVMLDRVKLVELSRLIQNNYYNFNCNDANKLEPEIPSEDMDIVLGLVCTYIKENDISPYTISDTQYYLIPVVDFNSIISESVYSAYSKRLIRAEFHKKYNTKVTTGRLDYVAKIDKKPVKCICIEPKYIDSVKIEFPEAIINADAEVKK